MMEELQALGIGANLILIGALVIKILKGIGFVFIVYALLGINFKLGDLRNKFCR